MSTHGTFGLSICHEYASIRHEQKKKKNTLWEKHMSALCSGVNFITITKSWEFFSEGGG